MSTTYCVRCDRWPAADGAALCATCLTDAARDPGPMPTPPDPAGAQQADAADVFAAVRGQEMTRSELALMPKPDDLIADVVAKRSAAVLVGRQSLGKSLLVIAWACCAAAEQADWLDHKVHPCPVLIVIGEGGDGLHDRIAAWEVMFNDGKPIPDHRLHVIYKPGSLSDKRTWDYIESRARAMSAGLIVLDTFSSLGPDVDETRDAAMIVRHMSDVAARIDAAVLLVHHPGWSDDGRARGGSQLEANSDDVLILRGVGGETSEFLTLQRKKAKNAPLPDVLHLRRAKPIELDAPIITWSSHADAGVPIRARLRVLLDTFGDLGASPSSMMTELQIAKSSLFVELNMLVAAGEVVRVKSGKTATYWLTEHAPAELADDRGKARR